MMGLVKTMRSKEYPSWATQEEVCGEGDEREKERKKKMIPVLMGLVKTMRNPHG